MAFLTDIKVDRVSFVRKAANKRTFVLLKSADSIINKKEKKEEEEVYKPMRKEVKDVLLKTLKVEENITKSSADIVDILKADVELKLSETEIVELNDYVDVAKAGFPFISPEDKKKKAEEEAAKLKLKKEDEEKMTKSQEDLVKEISSLKKSLDEITKATEKRDILSFLQKECAFLPEDIEKTADIILSLPTSAATAYKETLKKASAAVEHSTLLKEIGNSTDEILKSESQVDGFDLIKKFSTSLETIKKSAEGKPVSSETIVNLMKSFGPQYNDYRVAHILRAKREAI
jgi:hypothetical protein